MSLNVKFDRNTLVRVIYNTANWVILGLGVLLFKES